MINYKVLKKGDDYTAVGTTIDGVDIISSLIVKHGDNTTVFFSPSFNIKRKWRLLFRRPSYTQTQDIWLRKCLSIARSQSNAKDAR